MKRGEAKEYRVRCLKLKNKIFLRHKKASHITAQGGKPSGMLGKKMSEEAKKKQSDRLKGHPFWGRSGWHHSADSYTLEVRQRMSESHKGQFHSGWHHSEDTKKKMSEIKKGRSATNLGIPRTESQKESDRNIKLKAYLKRGQLCIKCIHQNSTEVKYFVSANEAAIQLTGLAGAMTTVQKMVNDPNWTSPKSNSKAWQMLKDWRIEYCSQSELLKHRLELA